MGNFESKMVKMSSLVVSQIVVWGKDSQSVVVMDTGMAPCDGSQVRGTTGWGRVRNFLPVTSHTRLGG